MRSYARSATAALVAGAAAVALLAPAAPAASAPAASDPARPAASELPGVAGERVIREHAWVRTRVDSDGDGRRDRVHVEVARPASTERGARLPVVVEASPYFSGGNPVRNHDVDVELYVPPRDPADPRQPTAAGEAATRPLSSIGPSRYEDYLLPRGFAFVYAESLGTGSSDGCPTIGGWTETAGAKAVVDWLTGRAPAFGKDGRRVQASWSTGKVGMIGVSYNGTLASAVAATGVRGLRAIVPIAAISSWYDYYRADGAVVAPGGYQGEDADVLAKFVLTRDRPRVCRDVIDRLTRRQDRRTGDYSRFWAERNYVDDAGKVRAAVLAAHGLNDWNVKTGQVAQWYRQLRRHNVPHKIWLHQGGHTDPYFLRPRAWPRTVHRWFARWLSGVRNGADSGPRATVQRERGSWREQADWPAPRSKQVTGYLRAGGRRAGGLTVVPQHRRTARVETVVDDARKRAHRLAGDRASRHRLVYRSAALDQRVRISGRPAVALRVSFSKPAANVTALLVDYAPDGSLFIVTRGWTDPQNRHSVARTDPITPGVSYRVRFGMQPDDYVFRRGHGIGVVLLSSDHNFTLRPRPGTKLGVDIRRSTVRLPVVGGREALADATR